MGEAKRKKAIVAAICKTAPIQKMALNDVGTVRTDTVSEACMEAGIREFGIRAFKAQGNYAFESPAEAAAIHEAGHCVMHRVLGNELTSCRIEERHDAKWGTVWLGVTADNAGKWISSPESNPFDDLDRAAIVAAGVFAERLFHKCYRQGSSLDELVLFQMLCANAAGKLGKDRQRMTDWMHENIDLILRQHQDEHQNISSALLQKKILRSDDLAVLVAPIKPAGKQPWKLELERAADQTLAIRKRHIS